MKRLLILAIMLFVFFTQSSIVFSQAPAIDAGAYLLMDLETGEVLLEENSEQSLYPASTTKIMTAILALENGDLDEVMTASQSAIDDIGVNGSNIGIIAGEKIKLENLLQALLISSANESANIIAENISPSREEFIKLMNTRARQLGATNTHFANACGIHDPSHYTTASDLAKMAMYAMTFPEFRKIVSTKTYTMPATNKHSKWEVLSSTNKLMISDSNELYEINGLKTGFTGPAGYNLISTAVDENSMELLSIVMAVKNEGARENVQIYSKELLDYGFKNFKKFTLVKKDKVYRNVKVLDAVDIFGLDLITSDTLTCVLPKDDSLKYIKEIPHITENITAPINEGDIMGYVEYLKNDIPIGRITLTAARAIEQKAEPITPLSIAKKFLDTFYGKLIIAVVGFIIFVILLRTVLKRISRSVNAARRR